MINSVVFFWRFVEHHRLKKGTLGISYGIRFPHIPGLTVQNVQHSDIWKA